MGRQRSTLRRPGRERSVPTVRMPQRNIPSEFWATEEWPVRHHHPQLRRLRILALTI